MTKKKPKAIQVMPKSKFPWGRPTQAMQGLSPVQLLFAQWLATSAFSRQPKTQKDLAEQIGVSEGTLADWKALPELWQAVDDYLGDKGRELVPEALDILKELIASPHKALALKAAVDVLDRWSAPKKHAGVIACIRDLWDIHKEVLESKQEGKGEYGTTIETEQTIVEVLPILGI